MGKAARLSDSMDSSNPCRWRGKWLHHHVMVFVRSFVHFVQVLKLKWLILPTYKVNSRYFLMHLGVHHTNRTCVLIMGKFLRDGDGRGISKAQVNIVI
jgi:hypothetical protein